MEITKSCDDKKVTLSFKGWLDTDTHFELKEELDKLSDMESLTFDFAKLEYISSSGLREVISAYKRSKDEDFAFKIINASPQVMSIFQMTGLDTKLNVSN